LPVQFLDLPAVHLVGQIGDVDGELMFVLVPKLRVAGRRRDALQRAGEDHPSGGFPASKLDPALGHLAGPQDRRSLPIRFLDTMQRGADQSSQFHFEQKLGPAGSLLVPGHDPVMTEAQITAVEGDFAIA